MYEKFKVESAWLKERGLKPATLERYGVFEYYNASRKSVYNGSVMIRISRYSDGECVGYLSRNIGEVTAEKPKYRFPEGLQKSLELFGAWQLKDQAPIRVLYLVESPFSVMHFHQLGLPAVSAFGWAVSEAQVEIISKLAKGVCFLPDSNKRKEAMQYAGTLTQKVWVKMPELPVGLDDPEHLTAAQIAALL